MSIIYKDENKLNNPPSLNSLKIPNKSPSIVADWVINETQLKAAQKLRYKIFKKEFGANMHGGYDKDTLDKYCEHLVIKDTHNHKLIGTYRILTPVKAREYGSLYAESEFKITGLDELRPRMIELGRACIDKEYRNGTVIMLLWAEIAKFMLLNNYDYLIGCSSVSVRDGGYNAANIYKYLQNHKQYKEIEGIYPFNPLPVEHLMNNDTVNIPPLLNGYLRLGANIIGKPAWDPEFQTADFLTILKLDQMPSRYKSHFLKSTATS